MPTSYALGPSGAHCIPAARIAVELGSAKVTNMAMLGALLELTHTLPRETAFALLRQKVRDAKLLELDCLAIDAGMDCLRKQLLESPSEPTTPEEDLAPCSQTRVL